jgi:exopolysaccharide biosynthesis polyprenyl glycosylphosphotransferase
MSGRLGSETLSGHDTSAAVDARGTSSPLSVTGTPSPRELKRRLMMADAAALAAGIVVAFELQHLFRPVPRFIVWQHLALTVVAVPAICLGAAVNKLYQARANERPEEELWNILKTVGLGVAVLVAAAFALQYDDLSRLWVILLGASITGALVIERHFARNAFAKLRKSGQICRRIVIVGTDPHAIGLMHTYERNPDLGYRVVGFVGDDDLGRRGGVEVLGPISDLTRVLHEQQAVGVVVSLASVESDDVNAFTRSLTEDGFHVALSSALRDIDIARLRPQQLDGRTMIYVEPVMRGGWRAVAKRLFDIGLALVILVATSPILLAAMIAIRLDSKGPIFFRQVRVGRNGELFTLIKLRTMVVDAEERKADLAALNEADGPLFKIHDDPRITKVGRVLRKLSIDELPQLFCVIAGRMSMVGPRPALPDEVARWDEEVSERLRVLPGLTGMWQVSGRSDSTFETYKRLDLYYVDNWSLRHDAEICLRTVRVVLTGSGAA